MSLNENFHTSLNKTIPMVRVIAPEEHTKNGRLSDTGRRVPAYICGKVWFVVSSVPESQMD